MSVLTKLLLHANERLELEDINLILSSIRTDSKFQVRRFLADENFIIQGFTISNSTGTQSVSVDLTDATLIHGPATQDFSWYTAENSPTPLSIPFGTGGLQPGRNYVELVVGSQQGTKLQRAFWDPSANGGQGAEFTNEVDTVVELTVNVEVNQSGFNSSNPDKIPLAIIDLDSSSTVRGIQDKRKLFFRLGEPDNIKKSYAWVSQEEPATTLVFTAPSGIAFQAGETITFSSGATAKVRTGGTQNIEVYDFSGLNYNINDTLLGNTSGATATLLQYYEDFEGADKSLNNFKDLISALQTEIKALKGTDFWYEVGPAASLPSLLSYINATLVSRADGGRYEWTGTDLFITDNKTSGQATSDVIASIRILGKNIDLDLTRQDNSGGSASISIPDQYVLYVELPQPLASRTYSENGNGATNYRVVHRNNFIETDYNFVLGIREGNKFFSAQFGELEPGEQVQISDQTVKNTLAFIGAASETDTTPPYTTLPDPALSNQFTTNDSLTQAISINAANINDIVQGLLKNYYEPLRVVSGSPADDNEVQGPLVAGTNLTLPLDSRDGDAQKKYLVGNGALMVFLRGQHLSLGIDYEEVGAPGTLSDKIRIQRDLVVGDLLEFRLMVPEIFGNAGIPQPFFRNYITGQNGQQINVGNLYNSGTFKLAVYRNGLLMLNSTTVGDPIDRYTEPNNNSVLLEFAANPQEVFTFLNVEDPAPSVVYITGQTGTTLTVPSYSVGSGRLQLYRNGVLMSTNPSAPADNRYTETSSTTVELATAAQTSDVFIFYNAGTAPQWRESATGLTGTVITIPNSQSYTPGDNKLQVFRNGILLYNSTTLGQPVDRYQETSSTSITLEVALDASDLIEFIYLA